MFYARTGRFIWKPTASRKNIFSCIGQFQFNSFTYTHLYTCAHTFIRMYARSHTRTPLPTPSSALPSHPFPYYFPFLLFICTSPQVTLPPHTHIRAHTCVHTHTNTYSNVPVLVFWILRVLHLNTQVQRWRHLSVWSGLSHSGSCCVGLSGGRRSSLLFTQLWIL